MMLKRRREPSGTKAVETPVRHYASETMGKHPQLAKACQLRIHKEHSPEKKCSFGLVTVEHRFKGNTHFPKMYSTLQTVEDMKMVYPA